MGVQQGSLKKAHNSIRRRVAIEQPADEFALTRITVVLNGQRARRSNPRSHLLRNSPVKGLERYLAS